MHSVNNVANRGDDSSRAVNLKGVSGTLDTRPPSPFLPRLRPHFGLIARSRALPRREGSGAQAPGVVGAAQSTYLGTCLQAYARAPYSESVPTLL